MPTHRAPTSAGAATRFVHASSDGIDDRPADPSLTVATVPGSASGRESFPVRCDPTDSQPVLERPLADGPGEVLASGSLQNGHYALSGQRDSRPADRVPKCRTGVRDAGAWRRRSERLSASSERRQDKAASRTAARVGIRRLRRTGAGWPLASTCVTVG